MNNIKINITSTLDKVADISLSGERFVYTLITKEVYNELELQIEESEVSKTALAKQSHLKLTIEERVHNLYMMGSLKDYSNFSLKDYVPENLIGDRWHHKNDYFTQNALEYGELKYITQSFNVSPTDMIKKLAKKNNVDIEKYPYLLVSTIPSYSF